MSTMQQWFRRENGRISKWHAVERVEHGDIGGYRDLIAPCGFASPGVDSVVMEEDVGVLPISGLDDDRGTCLHCIRWIEMARREDDGE
jgi:hypothetical protein